MERNLNSERLVILRHGVCDGCPQLTEARRLAELRAAEIGRLERELEAFRHEGSAQGGPSSSAAASQVQRRLFETPSVGELALAGKPRS
jgi:hypothetical protein